MHDGYAIVHVLKPLKTSHQLLNLIDLHERELDLTVLLPLVHALFSFIVSSVSSVFGVSIMFGLVVWIGVLLKKLSIRVFGRYLDKEYSFRQSFCSVYHADNPDLVPIIMRSKELELYRNGCTQRIRAPERNLPNGELPHENMVDQYSLIKNESVIEVDGKGEGLHIVPFF